uniref:Hyaluronidase n=1 Tax=Orancistrocerus drewseni TaxID=529024 RepID=B2ZP63_ORADR|nr:hyaluronidase [Orancistrocerus drewseni]
MILLVAQLLLVLIYPFVHAGLVDLCGLNCFPAATPPKRHFYIYWNVPTVMCHKYGLDFSEVKTFNILQNNDDKFRGDIMTIMYDPGQFPAMVPHEQYPGQDKYKRRNGGVPQMGKFNKHKTAFIEDLDTQIPNVNFSGIGVIDFEKWKPIFRQNWGETRIHKNISIELVKQVHSLWSYSTIKSEAAKQFEKHARYFMEETLNVARENRVKADWGYYGYPYCYNLSPGNPGSDCDSTAMSENDKMSWLFNNQNVLLPSVYVKFFLKAEERVGLVRGRVKEAVRIMRNTKHKPRVIPYWWYKYTDQTNVYLSQKDVENTFKEILFNDGEGIIIWGSSADVDSRSKCKSLRSYLTTVLGPIALAVENAANNGTPLTF